MSHMTKELCWSCAGNKLDPWGEPCEWCDGRGWCESRRDYIFSRRRQFLGHGHPNANKDGNEKYERFACEIPPEIAAELDLLRKQMTSINGMPSRAAVTRMALRELLEKRMPEAPPSIDSDAEEYVAEIAS